VPVPPADLVVQTDVTGAQRDSAWAIYQAAFERLRVLAVQRHVMTRAEFDDVCADVRVQKYLGVTRSGQVCAFGSFTNDLSAMPLVSEDYYAHRWPEHHRAGRIWYIGCVGVHPEHRSSGIFSAMVERMVGVVEREGGVASIDICRHNEQELALPRLIGRLVDTVSSGAAVHRLDEQTYWAYEFPAPELALA
jgi:ribosomal protein S18 acetylase RimI-like enzyme